MKKYESLTFSSICFMFYVYILKSLKDKSLYIGFTPDLRNRIEKHNNGEVFSTKDIRPLKLVYYEAYLSKKDAINREQQLKRFAKGFYQLKGRLEFSLKMLER